MNLTFLKNHKLLFLIVLTFFGLGFIDIHFGLLGVFCMGIPIYLLLKTNKKTYCSGYCPRANLLTTTTKKAKFFDFKTPKAFTQGNVKWIMLTYFSINIVLMIASTVMAAKTGNGILSVKFFILIPGFSLPETLALDMPVWVTHLSYRFYSMMYSTTILGIILGIFYKPRTWCTICPINTVSDAYVKSVKNKANKNQ